MPRGRRDANEAMIVEYLRLWGYDVYRLEDSDHAGLPDLLVLGPMACPHCHHMSDQARLIEIKTASGKLRPEQRALLTAHPLAAQLARTIVDAALVMGGAPPVPISRGERHVAQTGAKR